MSKSTSTAIVDDLARLKERVAHRNVLAADGAELREKIDEMEREYNGIAFWLEEAERELQRLNGGGLTGLIFAALGKRGTKVETKQRELDGLREDFAAFGKLLESARGDLAALESDLAQLADVQSEYDALRAKRRDEVVSASGAQAAQLIELTRERDEGKTRVKALIGAVESGREAIDHLHDEVHVIASMGRCRMAEGHGLLRVVLNAGRKHAVGDCAGRAGKSLERFRRRAEKACVATQSLAPLVEAETLVANLSGEVRTGKHEVRTVNHETVSRIDGILRAVVGDVEHALTAQRDRIAWLDDRIETILEQS